MKYSLIIITFVALLSSCSNVNTDSRQHYEEQQMRHGIVPLHSTEKNPQVVRVLDKKSVTRGKKIFKSKCMTCHGADGRGVANVDLQSLSRDVPNFKFYLMVSRFKQQMPGWKNVFTEREVKDLENYIHSLMQGAK